MRQGLQSSSPCPGSIAERGLVPRQTEQPPICLFGFAEAARADLIVPRGLGRSTTMRAGLALSQPRATRRTGRPRFSSPPPRSRRVRGGHWPQNRACPNPYSRRRQTRLGVEHDQDGTLIGDDDQRTNVPGPLRRRRCDARHDPDRRGHGQAAIAGSTINGSLKPAPPTGGKVLECRVTYLGYFGLSRIRCDAGSESRAWRALFQSPGDDDDWASRAAAGGDPRHRWPRRTLHPSPARACRGVSAPAGDHGVVPGRAERAEEGYVSFVERLAAGELPTPLVDAPAAGGGHGDCVGAQTVNVLPDLPIVPTLTSWAELEPPPVQRPDRSLTENNRSPDRDCHAAISLARISQRK